MKKVDKTAEVLRALRTKKRTSIGRGVTKTSSMNKGKKRSFKKYRGQG